MVAFLFHLTPHAQVLEYNGFTYEVREADGKIFITGYIGSETDITLPATIYGKDVQFIKERAFEGNNRLTSIIIPNNVTSIGDYAFAGCNSLTSIALPQGVTRIGDGTFYYCSRLARVTLPDGIISIGNGAFYDCSSLADFTIPAGVSSIGDEAFEYSGLFRIAIPAGVNVIGTASFAGCYNMTEITVASGNTRYTSLDGVLFNADKTVLIQCPGGKTGNYAIPNSVASVGDWAFRGYSTLTSVSIPDTVTSIGQYAFSYCTGMTRVIFRNTSRDLYIGDYAFDSSYYLEGVYFEGKPPTTIGTGLFGLDDNVTIYYLASYSSDWNQFQSGFAGRPIAPWTEAVVFLDNLIQTYNGNPKSVTATAFPEGLSVSVTYNGDPNPPSDLGTYDVVATVDDPNYPGSASGVLEIIPPEYEFSVNGDETSITITKYNGSGHDQHIFIPDTINEYSVTAIGDSAFVYNSAISHVTIPDSVTSIGDGAFFECENLTHVSISKNMTSLGAMVFAYCYNLIEIDVDSRNPAYASLGGALFDKNRAVLIQYPLGKPDSSYTIPNTVASIADFALAGGKNLINVSMQDGVTTIGTGAFAYCDNLDSVGIPSSMISIGDRAFKSCKSLPRIYIPENVANIGTFVFDECEKLESITVAPGNAAYASEDGVLFNGNKTVLMQFPGDKAGSYTVPDSVTSIKVGAFAFCDHLNEVTIGNSVITIEGGAFYNCENLTRATIPASLTTIGSDTFAYCYKLTGVFFKGNVPIIDGYGYSVFNSANDVIVYYRRQTTGWGPTFAEHLTALWDDAAIWHASDYSLTVNQDETIALSAGKLLKNAFNPDGLVLTVSAVSERSSQGGFGSLEDNQLGYSPADGFYGKDTLNYIVTDKTGYGSGATITITVVAKNAVSVTSDNGPNVVGLPKSNSDGSMTLTFAGIPGFPYQVQACDEVGQLWQNIGDPITAGPDGLFSYTDMDAKYHTSRFYRTVKPE